MNELSSLLSDLASIGALGNRAELNVENPGWENRNLNQDFNISLEDVILGSGRLTIPDLESSSDRAVEGVEAMAWYIPYHFEVEDWGIYLTCRGIENLAIQFAQEFLRGRKSKIISQVEWEFSVVLAMKSLIAHEMFHHQYEVALTRLELATATPLYVATRKLGLSSELRLLEEAVATSRMVSPRVSGAMGIPKDLIRAQREAMKNEISRLGAGYRRGTSYLKKHEFFRAKGELLQRASGRPSLLSEAGSAHASVMYGEIHEVADRIMLRFDDSNLSDELRSISLPYMSIKRDRILKFLESFDVKVGKQGKHPITFTFPGSRQPIPIPFHGKELTMAVLSSVAKAVGVKLIDLPRAIDGVLDGSISPTVPLRCSLKEGIDVHQNPVSGL